MAVAAEYKIGHTSITIDDQYCKDQSQEQVDAILKNISRIFTRHYKEEEYQRQIKDKKAI